MQKEFIVDESAKKMRLDAFLALQMPDNSRSKIQALIKENQVKCNNNIVDLPRFAVKTGMTVSIEVPEYEEIAPLVHEDFDYEILFEDDSILVINKPAGAIVHPGAGNQTGTIVNALLSRYPAWEKLYATDNIRPGIVHRLDKDTSGCLVIAKNPDIQFKMSKLFAERSCEKHYLAIVHGVPKNLSGEISNLIGRHPVNRQKMAVVERNGKTAISQYKVQMSGLVNQVALSAVSVKILTGRTHQIRVHMSSIKHPVLGDDIYGGDKGIKVMRQMLHAQTLKFPHPVTQDIMTFFAPVPSDIQEVLDKIQETKISKIK